MDKRLKEALEIAKSNVEHINKQMHERIKEWIFAVPPAHHQAEYYEGGFFSVLQKAAEKPNVVLDHQSNKMVDRKTTSLMLTPKDIPSSPDRRNDARKLAIAAEMLNTIDGLKAEVHALELTVSWK